MVTNNESMKILDYVFSNLSDMISKYGENSSVLLGIKEDTKDIEIYELGVLDQVDIDKYQLQYDNLICIPLEAYIIAKEEQRKHSIVS